MIRLKLARSKGFDGLCLCLCLIFTHLVWWLLNLRILHEQLVKRIHQFASDAREHRQVYQRLSQLLPDRLKALTVARKSRGVGPSEATREAFASDEFVAHIEDVVRCGAASREARIQYETHMMLVDARRSLRRH